jgi:membrane-bound lytic murein transglycosylase B
MRTLIVFAVFAFGLSCTTYTYAQEAFFDGLSREQLQQQLKNLEKDIESNKGELETKKGERRTIERDLSILDAKVKEAKLSLQRRDLELRSIGHTIKQKETHIESLDARAKRARASLGQLLRSTRQRDDETLVEVFLRGDSLSNVFNDTNNVATVQNALSDTFETIRTTKKILDQEKAQLEESKIEQEELRAIQERERAVAVAREQEKATVLKATKGKEKEYEQYIKQQEKTAGQLRKALFSLRDSTSGPITFETMLKYAEEASAETGVRVELILAILTEESNLGKNVGKGTWTKDMHPTRDRPVFKEICAELGLDPDKMPVSKKAWYGWGGAMGPGQFIPSTWKDIRSRISRVTGQNPPNPWNPRTATFATALYMKDNGAGAKTRAAERLASLRYLAGWGNANKPAYAFYGNEVMALVEKYEREIRTIRGQ